MSTTLRTFRARMIRTRYLGPTDTRGGRVLAYSVGAGNRPGSRVIVSWDHALDACANHEAAALALHEQLTKDSPYNCLEEPDAVAVCGEDGGGYVFAFVRQEVRQ